MTYHLLSLQCIYCIEWRRNLENSRISPIPSNRTNSYYLVSAVTRILINYSNICVLPYQFKLDIMSHPNSSSFRIKTSLLIFCSNLLLLYERFVGIIVIVTRYLGIIILLSYYYTLSSINATMNFNELINNERKHAINYLSQIY